MKHNLAATLALLALAATPALAAQFTDANAIVGSIGKSQFMRAAGQVDGASSVRVEKLSTFMGASGARDKLALAETIYERDLDYLHRNLMMNPIATQAIRAAGFEINDIVALSLDSEGSAILYADDVK